MGYIKRLIGHRPQKCDENFKNKIHYINAGKYLNSYLRVFTYIIIKVIKKWFTHTYTYITSAK